MPDLIAVSYQRCQSRIDIPADAPLATCGQCGARLAVRRSDTAAWTEIIGEGEGEGEGESEAEAGPSANVTREEFDALKRRIELEALERDALTKAGLAIAGHTGRLMVPMVPSTPNAQGDAAAPRWIDVAAMRRKVSVFRMLPILLLAGCALTYAASSFIHGSWVMELLCLGGFAVVVSPGIIGFFLSRRRLDAYEAERRAYDMRRSAILATDDPAADVPVVPDPVADSSADNA